MEPLPKRLKSDMERLKGLSMEKFLITELVRDHITSLRQSPSGFQYKDKDRCQLCGVEKLTFEPAPMYCSRRGCRIARDDMYYELGGGDTRHYYCVPCYDVISLAEDTILVQGEAFRKAAFEEKKNDVETEELWVQCDKCEAWQHHVCALVNGRINHGAKYICLICWIEEIEKGEREPLPQSAILGANDLPRTMLSDHIEERLFRRLKYERQERARVHGKCFDEVPGVEGIVVRVVSSVDRKLEVKPRFLQLFREENYPSELLYKSKVILLFQKMDGVDVCLFGMYVQEFGSECQPPNQRRINLSCFDSVKYFRPEVKAVTGEALRTFVYHEILIGYLEYCKKRGFTSCYMWASPPPKGEDNIFYCHPEVQKAPNADKLREWHMAMLKKASDENTVVEVTNLYDHFFVSTGECKAKVTAARLPYFDGDYWPGAAEEIIEQLVKETGQSNLSSNSSKHLLLMDKLASQLGDEIMPMKDNFIMVHLQYSCTHCCTLMVSGNRWVCKQCKNFQICDECYEAEQKLDEEEKHNKDTHTLYSTKITGVPDDTKDEDEILESEFFITRQAFLSLSEGCHYRHDTLRRAKHSSMMVLYHLHNPTPPVFVATCKTCHREMQGWRCQTSETCRDYDICNACYQMAGGIDHPSLAGLDAQNKEARQQRVSQLRKMLDALVHTSQCRSSNCCYPNCGKVKGVYRHGLRCKVRASGGCVVCKKSLYLLQLHARGCQKSGCHVPLCRALTEHLGRFRQESDSRRRVAAREMARNGAAQMQE